MSSYPRLFSKLKVAGHTLENRVIMTSMGTNFADAKGLVTPAMLEYYRARAAGRPGLMVVEAAAVHPSGKVIERNLMIHSPEVMEGLKELTKAIKEHPVTVVLQIYHGGRNAHPRLVGEPLAPSPLRGPTSKTTPRAMTLLEIEAMVEAFGRAAGRAREAGFDGIEIHGAHEYLVHQFMTPNCNQRSDAYGGDLEKRCRFAVEVVRAIREAMGPDAILAFRLSGDDHVRNGLTPQESAKAAVLLEKAGVDLFSVTGGVYETPHMVVPPLPEPAGTHLEAAAVIREAVNVPVAGVGRLNNPQAAEEALAKVDLAACGRAFLADPDWLQNAATDKERRTRPCIGCNQGCIDHVLRGIPITCVANPWLGLENEKRGLGPVENPAKVVVAGGGLAGLEAALILDGLGHEVVLMEKSGQLGGQINLAAAAPGKDDFNKLMDYYLAAIKCSKRLEVRLDQEADVDAVCAENPFAAIIACGSLPVIPNLPGAHNAPMVTAREVLAGTARVGERVAVLGGGNLGSEVAHYLAKAGHQVCIIELGLGIASDLGPARRYLLRRELMQYKIRRYTRAQVRRLYSDRVSFLHTSPEGARQPVDVGPLDTFVSALGAKPNEQLYLALEGKVEHLFLVGDALSPARMGEATAEGARAALNIHALAGGQTGA